MNLCNQCISQVEDGKKFCADCGQPLLTDAAVYSATASGDINSYPMERTPIGDINTYTIQDSPAGNFRTKYRLKATPLIIALSSAIVVFLLAALYFTGAALNSKEKQVAKITAAIESGNSDKLADFIICSDSKLKIDGKSLEPLMSYMSKTPSFKNELIQSVQKQSADASSSSNLKDVDRIANSDSNRIFTLQRHGKTWLLFDKYVLEIKPVYIKVSTNYKDTEISIGDTGACTASKENFTKQIGPFAPGLYKIKAFYKGQYADIEKTDDVDLVENLAVSDEGQLVVDKSMELDGSKAYFHCDYADAKLFINGKDTGMLANNAKDIGPFPRDGSVKCYAQRDYPWGKVNGKEVALEGQWSVELELNGLNDDIKNKIMDAVQAYAKSWIEALISRDPSKITGTTDNKKVLQSQKIQSLINNNQFYSGSLNNMIFDLDSFRIEYYNKKYYVTVLNEETQTEVIYNEGSEFPQASAAYRCRTTLVYDETSKAWLVDTMDDSFSRPGSNTKGFKY